MQIVSGDNLSSGESSTNVPEPARLPTGFRSVSGRSLQQMDRQLGYFGSGRYVFFYYEPRGQEVIWNDGRSYGFGFGGWQIFTQDVAPVAEHHGADLGNLDRRGSHVLLLDRTLGQAYFADHAVAEQFLAEQAAA